MTRWFECFTRCHCVQIAAQEEDIGDCPDHGNVPIGRPELVEVLPEFDKPGLYPCDLDGCHPVTQPFTTAQGIRHTEQARYDRWQA